MEMGSIIAKPLSYLGKDKEAPQRLEESKEEK